MTEHHETQVLVTQSVNRLTASAYALASDYKFRRMNRNLAWDNFIIDRALKPEMSASDFHDLFDRVSASPLQGVAESVSFEPTHIDTLVEGKHTPVQIKQQQNGVFAMIWANGSTGSQPPCYPPDPKRFVAVGDYRTSEADEVTE
jgi:hypothetical protein